MEKAKWAAAPNVITAVAATIVMALATWSVTKTQELAVQVAVMSEKIEGLRRDVNKLKGP
jgi:cytochrome oxidase assembly protein ShyY1